MTNQNIELLVFNNKNELEYEGRCEAGIEPESNNLLINMLGNGEFSFYKGSEYIIFNNFCFQVLWKFQCIENLSK